MKTIFYIFIRFLFVICKLFALIWHSLLSGKTVVSRYFKIKAENFLFFSPRVFKRFYIKKEVKDSFERIRLFTPDLVKITAYYLAPAENKPVVIFFHGQSENISKWQDTFLFLKKLGCGALFLSYRGHLNSAGRPCEKGVYIDAVTAVEYLLNDKRVSENNIILWGRSLGSAVAVQTALKYNVKAVIIESGILNIKEAALSVFARYIKRFHILFLRTPIINLIKNADFIQNFSNEQKINKIKSPILILHAENDVKINFQQAVKLHELNPSSELVLVKDGSHDYAHWCFPFVEKFINSLS